MIAVDRLLDTNFLISRWREGRNSPAAKWLRDNADLAGAAVAGHQPGAVRAFLDRFPAIWPDNTTLDIYATQFARLRAANTLPGPHDLWIAATALQFGIPLVTRNTAQFARIEGIRLESY
jgi:predicted nucleic acid-binding protein